MTLVPLKYGRLKTTSFSSPWKQDRNLDDVVCVVLLPRQSKWRISSTLTTTTKPIYLSVFAPLILLIVIIIRLTSATKHHYNPPVSFELGNPWIPIDFLTNYTFNANLGVCGDSFKKSTCGSSSNKQCLLTGSNLRYLERAEDRRRFCDMKSSRRMAELSTVHLRYCQLYTLNRVLSKRLIRLVVNGTHSKCLSVLEELSLLENKIRLILCEFNHVLHRYDCYRKYSAKWTCINCQIAYNSWVCSMFVPFYDGYGQHQKPCREFCTLVEQQCPYFLPVDKRQYAGEPSFACIDPNIPDTPEIAELSPYSVQGSCYKPCHLKMQSNKLDKNCEVIKVDKRTKFSSFKPSSPISSISSTTKHHQSVIQSHSKYKHSSKTESNSKDKSISYSVLTPSSCSTKITLSFVSVMITAFLPIFVTAHYFQIHFTKCDVNISTTTKTTTFTKKTFKKLDYSLSPT